MDAVAPEQQLRFFYQPVVDRETRAALCAEAIIRSEGPNGDWVEYRDLMDRGDSTDSMHARTAFVLDQVLTDLPKLKRIFGSACGVALPLSNAEIEDTAQLVALVRKALLDHKVQPSDLSIYVALDPTKPLSFGGVRTLEALQAERIKVTLDQWSGVIHRSYGKIFYDFVKLDKDLVQRMMAQAPTRSVVAAVSAFCESAGVKLAAAGVDDAMILSELESLHCPYVQGGLFGDPVEIDGLRPRVYQPSVPAPAAAVDDATVTAEHFESLRTRVERLDARAFDLEFADFLARAEEIRAELGALSSERARQLSCILGQQVTAAAVYASEKIAALDWGLETSKIAEELGQFGDSAQMLALISTVPVSTESSRFVRVEALSRALQIRATTQLDPEASGMLDNSLAMALAHMGLTDRATAWWTRIVSEHEDLDLPGHSYAAVNLAELQLAMLEDPEYDGSDTSRATSLRRIERATSRLERSQYARLGLSESFRARQAVLAGDIDLAFQRLDPWLTKKPLGIVSQFIVTRARAVLARAAGDNKRFLEHTSLLVDEIAPTELLRHHRTQIMILHIDALTRSSRIADALSTQRQLIDFEIELGKRRASAMFDWMQIRVDVDLQFAHYAGVARRPETAGADG